MRGRSPSGFTLVELVTVIAIVAMILALGTPALLGAMPGLRVSGAARHVLSDMRQARSLAIEKGIPVVFDVHSPSTAEYRVYVDNDDNGAYLAGTDDLVKEVALSAEYDGISLKTNDAGVSDYVDFNGAGADQVVFRTNGSASGSGSVYMMPSTDPASRNDRNRRVRVVASTGNLRIENYDGSTWQ